MRRTQEFNYNTKAVLPFSAAALVGVVCIVPACIRFIELERSYDAYLCNATIINEQGWTEDLSGGDPDVVRLLDNQMPLFWDHCEASDDADSRMLQWRQVLTEIVNAEGDGSFRGHPGRAGAPPQSVWEVAALRGEGDEPRPILSCYIVQTESRVDAPDCLETSEEPLDIAEPMAECLVVSPQAIVFGAHATFSEGPSQTIELRNYCDHPIEVVVDEEVTCHDDWVRECLQCADDPECKPDFSISETGTDCFPETLGDLSLTLQNRSHPDPDESRCTITVDFSPQARGPRLAQKVVSTADTGESFSVHLEGSGIGGQAALDGASDWCWDRSYIDAISGCVSEADRAELVVSNIAGSGAGPVVVNQTALDSGEDEGFRKEESWYRDGSDVPRTVEYPLHLDPGDQLHLTVDWCRALSNPPGGEGAGMVDEHAVLRIDSDDPFLILFNWLADGCR